MAKLKCLIIGTFLLVLLNFICSLEAKTIGKAYDYDNDDNESNIGRDPIEIDHDTQVNRTKVNSGAEDLEAMLKAENDLEVQSNSGVLETTTKTASLPAWNIWNDFNWDEYKKQQKENDDLMKALKDLDNIYQPNNNFAYKEPEYKTTYYYRGVNGYHVSGGFFVFALFVIFIRCCLICCRYQNRTTRGTVLLPETHVHAVIIQSRQRSNSKEDLMADAELPADDPPSYKDCTQNGVTKNDKPAPPYSEI